MKLTQNIAQTKAQNWVDAWNNRDLDAVMTHYADDVSVCSPLVKRRLNNSDGWLHGKSALRDYFAVGMGNPDLQFTLKSVHVGVQSMSMVYARENGIQVVDTMELNAHGLTTRMVACYSGGNTRV
jgi:ketosteroid isomerase-like protein